MNESRNLTVGFIGLGAMGAGMAANIQRAGYRLVVNDIRREAAEPHIEAGAIWADTARAVAEQSDVIFSSLPNLAAIEAVVFGSDGLLAGVRKGQAYFETSTNSPDLARRIHDAFAAAGADMLEAPVSGGSPGARSGRLAIWVGGEKAAYNRFEPVLRAFADQPSYIGGMGAAMVTKLVHNCAAQSIQAALAEIFVCGVKAGAEPLALWKAIRQGSIGRRRTFDGLNINFLTGVYEPPQAALSISKKDMSLALAMGRELGVPMPIAERAFGDINEAIGRGWAERDSRSVMLLNQERAGVHIAVDPNGIQQVFVEDPPAPTDTKNVGRDPA